MKDYGREFQNAVSGIGKRVERTSDTILAAADSGSFIDVTSGTFSQTFTAAATLGNGWFCWYRNSGSGLITFDPNGSELIDGATTLLLYSGECRLIQCTGSGFYTVALGSRVSPSKLYFIGTM